MGNTNHHSISATRQHLLSAALKCFAENGYAATSVQEIVDSAQVSKPALYYYFQDKAGLFRAVVEAAHDERFRLMQAAAERGRTVGEKLQEILADIFEYSIRNKELMRLTFATAFATTNDAPAHGQCRERGKRNFEFIRSLIQHGQDSGELARGFSSEELAMGIYGQLNSYVMIGVLMPECPLNRATAKDVVRLFLSGAANGHSPREERRRFDSRKRVSGTGSRNRN